MIEMAALNGDERRGKNILKERNRKETLKGAGNREIGKETKEMRRGKCGKKWKHEIKREER